MRTVEYVVLDLETCPIDNAETFIEEPTAPSNYRDEAKIAAYIAEKKRELVDRTALDLDLARVACLGWQLLSDEEPRIQPCTSEYQERETLERFFALYDKPYYRFVTFNGFKYDLPLLMRRAAYLGLPKFRPNLDRYRSPHVDLWNVLTNNGATSAHSLSWYVKRLGWTDLVHELDGKEVPAAVRAGEWDQIREHCAADVTATLRLARWLGVPMNEQPNLSGLEAVI